MNHQKNTQIHKAICAGDTGLYRRRLRRLPPASRHIYSFARGPARSGLCGGVAAAVVRFGADWGG